MKQSDSNPTSAYTASSEETPDRESSLQDALAALQDFEFELVEDVEGEEGEELESGCLSCS